MESAAFETSVTIYQYVRRNITEVSNLQIQHFYIQHYSWTFRPLKMGPLRCFETSGTYHSVTQRYIPVERIP